MWTHDQATLEDKPVRGDEDRQSCHNSCNDTVDHRIQAKQPSEDNRLKISLVFC